MTISKQAISAGALLIFSAAAIAQPPQQAAPGAGRGAAAPRIVSPEVLPDNRVIFRLRAPNASEVTVNGNWPETGRLRMTKDASGVWSATTASPVLPEIWTYTFSVDGVQMLDPGNMTVVRDTAPRMNSLLVRGPATAVFEPTNVPRGTVSAVWYRSPVTKADRRMMVYTPPGYETSTAKYPVLYLFHGGSGHEETWTLMGRTNIAMDNLIAQGKVKPMIVVMPNANWRDAAVPGEPAPVSAAAATPAGRGGLPAAGGGQNYDDAVADIVNGEIPYIESHYRVLAGRDNRAIAGLSMGGGIAINVGLKRLDVFSYVGEFSSGMFGGVGGSAAYDIEAISPGFLKDPAATNKKLKALYFSCGTEDPRMPFQTKAADELKSKGINLTFKSFAGAHEWRVWRNSLVDFAPMLFR